MSKKVSFGELIEGDKPVLVDFHATWCGPCKALAPVLEQVKNEVGDKATIVKVDIDKNEGFANHMNITGVPTLVIFKNGEEKWRQVGMASGQAIKAALEAHAA